MTRIILASASPQRSRLLTEAGIEFDVIPSNVDESLCALNDPIERAKVLSDLKAEDVFSKFSDACVIGADTLVVSQCGKILEKPQNKKHAREMLVMQSGKISQVHSAVTLITPHSKHSGLSTSHIRFRELSADDIDWWISTGLWKDRSGSFQIEGPGEKLIERLEGDYTGVVGLPMVLLGRLFKEAELEVNSE